MSYNIFERWPFTSFQNLNLDWLMNAVKEAVTTAEEAAGSVGQFDDRITANTNAIQLLQSQVGAIQGVFNVSVSSNLDATSDGSAITGSQIYNKMMQDKQLPYLFYQGECYAVEKWTTAGDMRFYTIHTTEIGDAVMRRIMVPAQSSSCAYSIVNLSGSGSSNLFVIRLHMVNGDYVSDHSYSEIMSALSTGKAPILLVDSGTNAPYVVSCIGVTSSNGVRFLDYPAIQSNGSTTVKAWQINSDNTISYYSALAQLASLDNIEDMAVLTTAQTLTPAEQAQARANIGAGGVDIVWGYQDEDQGNSVIRRKSDDTIYTPAQMLADESAGRLVLVESPHGIFYLTAAGNVLASFFNGATFTMAVASNGQYTEVAVPTGGEPVITNTGTTVQLSLSPNTFYIFPNATQLSISFTAGTAGVVNEYHFRFTSGSNATQLDLPATVEIPDDFDVAANTVYEVSIVDNYMVYSSWEVSA